NGLFSSRKIERATHRDVAIRYLTAGTHPDHDRICKFRRKNLKAFRESFVDVLELASELKLLKLGNLSLDDTHLKANASIDKNVNYQRAVKILAQLRLDIDELLAQAETADAEEQDNQKLPSFGPVDHDRISFALLNLNHVSKNFIEHSFLNGWLESPRAPLLSFGDSRNLKATEMVLASSLDEQLQGSSDQSYYPKRRVCPPHRITIGIIPLHSLGPRCLQMTRKGRYSIAAPIHGEKCLPSSRAI
ncbi:MAG: transposase, partial [Verrucomicrobiales bacterium]